MQITETMDLHQLDELIQKNFSAQQMDLLRTLLNSTNYRGLEDIPQAVWLSMLERIKAQTRLA